MPKDTSPDFSTDYFSALLDTLNDQIAVVDSDGLIEWVNKAWMEFAGADESTSFSNIVGSNYLTVIGESFSMDGQEVDKALTGIKNVLSGQSENFETEYSCNPLEEQMWFSVLVKPLPLEDARRFVIFHRDITGQKEIEEILRTSEERYQTVIENQTEVISKFTPDGIFTFVNDAYCRYVGQPAEDLIGQSIYHAVPEEEEEALRSYFRSFSSENPHQVVENPLRDASGDTRFFEWSNSAILDEDGNVIEFQSVGRDITARNAAEEARTESEARFKSYAEISSDWFWETDENHCFTFISDRYRDFTGIEPAQSLGKSRRDLAQESDDDAKWADHMADLDAHKPIREFQYQIVNTSGKTLFVSISGNPIFDTDGTFIGYRGTAADITERETANLALELSEQRNRSLVQLTPDALLVIEHGVILFANPAAVQFFAAPSESALLGQEILKFVKPEYHEEYLEIRKKRHAGNPVYMPEFGIIKLNGDEVLCESSGVTIPWGDTSAGLMLIRDITERKAIENLKTDFVSLVSHELRTPLTSILGSIGLLDGGALGDLPAKAADMVSLAHKNAERLASLVNDILDFEKLHSGGMEFRFEILDTKELLEEAVSLNASYADGFDVALYLEPLLEPLKIRGDRQRLLQVLTNLISNGTKFSPTGEDVKIAALNINGTVRISVTDKGPGIPHDFKDKLFDRFAQADTGDRRSVKGTGLGLAISKAIMDSHGGVIGLDESVGAGSRFYIELPQVG